VERHVEHPLVGRKASEYIQINRDSKNTEMVRQHGIAEITVKPQKARHSELLRNDLKSKIGQDALIVLVALLSEIWERFSKNHPRPFCQKTFFPKLMEITLSSIH
jgi:hypothetical protein